MSRAGSRPALRVDGKAFARLIHAAPDFAFRRNSVHPATMYVLSRFSCCRRIGRDLILESPLSPAHVVLSGPAAASCIAELARPSCATDLAARIPGISLSLALQFLDLLYNAGALSEVNDRGRALEEEASGLFSWEFHDLLFHARSRAGRHGNPVGRVNRFAGKRIPAAPTPQKPAKTVVSLHRPNLAILRSKDLPFTRVLEERRSRRVQGAGPITARQLGEFLYRTARVSGVHTLHGTRIQHRPYPCSGASYELELYPLIHRCAGIDPGLYHYDPHHHRLHHLSGPAADTRRLLASAAAAAHTRKFPQILILISAQFRNVALRYSSIAYASILKDVGVLFQTFYLVATAMRLSPCAIGAGDSDLFARTTGLDYYAETTVGEFMLGSRWSQQKSKSRNPKAG